MVNRPFSTHINSPEGIDALHDGVPEWMRGSLDDWIVTHLRDSRLQVRDNLIHSLERLLRAQLSYGKHGFDAFQELFRHINANQNLKLDVVEGILRIEGSPYSGTNELEDILFESGSKWKVVSDEETGVFSLQERVDETVTLAFEDLAAHSNDMSHYMVRAWNEAFGRSPNSSETYANSIKAIEAASWPVVIPGNNRATLSTIIRELEEHPELFSVSISEAISGAGIETVRQQMSLVWKGQTDRHGTAHPIAPSQEAAEQALFTTLSLCQQFSRDLIVHD